jgi:hypothetical protein
VHFARNLLAKVPKGSQDMVAAALRSVFVQAVAQAVAQLWNQVITMLTETISRRCGSDGAGQGGRPRFPVLPAGALAQDLEHLNPQERLNVAPRGALGRAVIKRRTRVVGIFPNDATIIRLAGALPLEQQEEWQLDGRRAFFEVSMAKLDKSSEPLQAQSIESCTRYSRLITDLRADYRPQVYTCLRHAAPPKDQRSGRVKEYTLARQKPSQASMSGLMKYPTPHPQRQSRP